MSDDRTPLRDVVKAARRERGLTQSELAEQVGMSQRWVSALEAGDVEVPRRATMQALSSALGVPVEDLYLAAGVADSKSGARRIAEALPHLDPDDPTLDLLMDGARRLSPQGRKALLKQLEIIADLQRQWEEDAARDGTE